MTDDSERRQLHPIRVGPPGQGRPSTYRSGQPVLLPIERRAPESAVGSDLVAMLEDALPFQQVSTGSPHEALQRHVLSAALRTLAAWLYEQSLQLAGELVIGANHHPPVTAWPLSRRECEVAVLITRGISNREIAEELVITLSTTERHVANILNKLGMRSRAQVAVWAIEHGLSALSAD
jgi:DNA-binding CsgD family transcriptional regulator